MNKTKMYVVKEASEVIHPCIRCGNLNKSSNDDVFCRGCTKAIISLMNDGGF